MHAPPPASPPSSGAGDEPTPAARKSAAGFFGALLVLLPLGILAQWLHRVGGLLWTEIFVFLAPSLLAVSGSNLRARAFLRLLPVPPGLLLLAGLAGASCTLVAVALQGALQRLLPAELLRSFDVSLLFAGPAWERWALAAVATFAAPVCEELAFRGYLMSALRLRLSLGASIAVSALLFALVHLDPVRFLGLLGLGVLFGWLVARSGSVWPAVVAHAGNNAVVAWALVSSPSSPEASPPPTVAQLALATALGLAVLLPVLALFRSAADAAPPAAIDPLEPLDPADPSRTFRLQRVHPALRVLLALGALALLALLARELRQSPFS